MTDSNDEKSFVIKDHRRFDSDGNDRDAKEPEIKIKSIKVETMEQPKSSSAAKSAASIKSQTDYDNIKAASPADPQGEMSFSNFVLSLATQAMMQLGEMQPPEGMFIEKDQMAARQTIDILAMIQAKSKGNLDPNEDRLIEEVLHNLRMSFVKVVSK